MTVQVEGFFDLHRFLFSVKGGLYMPEQSVRHRKETDADQQTVYLTIKGEMKHENNRQRCAGSIPEENKITNRRNIYETGIDRGRRRGGKNDRRAGIDENHGAKIVPQPHDHRACFGDLQ
jgi:hypothetical protein